MSDLSDLGRRAKAAGKLLAGVSTARKNAALERITTGLVAGEAEILRANRLDVAAASAKGVQPYFLDRLTLNPARLAGIAADVRNVIALPDPVGEHFDAQVLPNGLRLHKRRVPLGVLGVIYESRPNVTIDIVALALKSGNAAILRGGSETINSNRALMQVIRAALGDAGLPQDAAILIEDTDRARILELLHLSDYVDLIIPRGGAALHDFCRRNSTVTVVTGGMGINHLYVDASAALAAALEVTYNSKCQRVSVCNALSTLLVDARVAAEFVPRVITELAARTARDGKSMRFKCDARALAALDPATVAGLPATAVVEPAVEATDWDIEWLDYILGVKVVDTLDEAIAFVQTHSAGHTDAVCAENPDVIARFLNEVDSSAVLANASTRFNDGGQFGLGAEVIVSTQRAHARGPMGLRELTIYKWVCEGAGHVRPA